MVRQLPAAAAAALVMIFGATAASGQDADKCQATITKNAQKYASKLAKGLQKCEEGRLKGTITTDCATDPKTQDKIGKAAGKLAEKITGDCAGVALADAGLAGLVTRCDGGGNMGSRCVDDNDCPDAACSPVDECPAFLNGSLACDGLALTDAASIADCFECNINAKVQTAIDSFYVSLNAASEDPDDTKCQKDIGKRATKYFDKVEKSLAKCEDALLKGKVMSCPDAKATDKIGKALAKLNDAIGKSCDTPDRIARVLNSGKLYSTAPRWGSCGVTAPSTTAGLASTLACLAESAAECDVAASTGDTVCTSQLCGNGQIDGTETCDDGNTINESGLGSADICPSDCAVAACTPSGSVNVTVNFTPPAGMSLLSGVVLLSYDDSKISIPGSLGDPPVVARFASPSFATSPNDVDYAVRVVLQDPFLIGVAAGEAFTVQFDTCQGAPAPTAADLGCMFVDAADTNFVTVLGTTCSVTVGP
jgi:cysteine-rich repeat protein